MTYELSGGAADANVFNERGLQCVNLANGMTDIHTPNEHIAVADLEAMVDVTLALVDAAPLAESQLRPDARRQAAAPPIFAKSGPSVTRDVRPCRRARHKVPGTRACT